MHSTQSTSAGFQVNTTQMMVGAVLVGAAGIIGAVGMIVGGTALMTATRRWFRELEVPPGEVVKQKWHQTKSAATAGAQGWHASNGVHAHSGHS